MLLSFFLKMKVSMMLTLFTISKKVRVLFIDDHHQRCFPVFYTTENQQYV